MEQVDKFDMILRSLSQGCGVAMITDQAAVSAVVGTPLTLN
jgi:hypothetical protein